MHNVNPKWMRSRPLHKLALLMPWRTVTVVFAILAYDATILQQPHPALNCPWSTDRSPSAVEHGLLVAGHSALQVQSPNASYLEHDNTLCSDNILSASQAAGRDFVAEREHHLHQGQGPLCTNQAAVSINLATATIT